MKSDIELQQDVMDELAWEPSVERANIAVTAKGGVITLGGFVSNYLQKLAAETGLVTVLRRSLESLTLDQGDRRDDQAYGRVQAGSGADCADQWVAARPGGIRFGRRQVDAAQVDFAVSPI